MSYQSLYRRFRPQKFGGIRGQDHLVRALRHAVAEDRVGHAYLLSGPRGTGKTTTARILAKALNCPELAEGEPCGVCDSCRAIEQGGSFDLQELDAASNRGIGEMKELLKTVALGTPGRTRVYILDEVHMLTKEASAALLKSLEEPPAHVVFVLATTDPQKVLPTIRSRCQHFELHLLPAADLRALVEEVVTTAGLEVGEEQVEFALSKGGGSARDTLSALEQVAAAGSAPAALEVVDDLLDGLADGDTGRVLAEVQSALTSGREPRVIGEVLLERLRDAFLVTQKVELLHLSEAALARARARGEQLGARRITRAVELLGEALVEMRQAADPRIPLELALLRTTRPEADISVESLAERLDRLERRVAGSGPEAVPAPGPAPQVPPDERASATAEEAPGPSTGGGGPAAGARRALAAKGSPAQRPALGAHRSAERSAPRKGTGSGSADEPGESSGGVAAGGAASTAPVSDEELPTRDELTLVWGDTVLGRLSQRARTRWAAGRFLEVADGAAVFGLPNEVTCTRCEEQRREVEDVLASHFGRPVPVRLVVDSGSAPPPDALDPAVVARGGADGPDAADLAGDAVGPIEELEDAADDVTSGLARLTEAFPGSELVETEEQHQ